MIISQREEILNYNCVIKCLLIHSKDSLMKTNRSIMKRKMQPYLPDDSECNVENLFAEAKAVIKTTAVGGESNLQRIRYCVHLIVEKLSQINPSYPQPFGPV